MPQPEFRTAPAGRPRHAAGRASRATGLAAIAGARATGPEAAARPTDTTRPAIFGANAGSSENSGSYEIPAPRSGAHDFAALEDARQAREDARHRRPETLADTTRLRPVSAPPSTRRSADALFDPGQYEDSFIERGFPEVTRAQQRRDEAIRLAEDRRQTEEHRHTEEAAPRRKDRKAKTPAPRRGKHAAPNDLAITVRPIPAVRDAVIESLPAAKRAADSIREWALYTGDARPAAGAHRAPGTLPIESWLLIGKTRQQALLATLVAVGLMLIVIPVQQGGTDTSPVSATGRAATATAHKDKAKAPTEAAQPDAPAADAPAPAAPASGKPSASASAPADKAKPAVKVPQGAGPASSLRTTGTHTVALTFDDGPDPVTTPKILAMLADYDVKATFCLVGKQVQRHPEIVQQIVAAGHTLCNHTWDHSLVIGKQKSGQIQADLERTNDAIHAAAPGAPIPFFRAPGGNFTDRLVETAYADGMTSLYWQVDPQDWNHLEGEDDAAHVDRVVDGVKKHVQPGSIVLSHDFNQPDTIKAYEQLLPWLTKNFELGLPPQETPATTTPAEPSAEPSAPPVTPSDQAGT